jgi:hypothetical protein
MNTQLKRKIAFSLSMGVVTTGIISFVLLALNLGFSNEFPLAWLRSWAVGYMIGNLEQYTFPLRWAPAEFRVELG